MTKACTIKNILAREIFDSRGILTIEIDVITNGGWGRNSAPFGASGSRGEFEASAYGSVGISGAVDVVVEELVPRLIGMDASEFDQCDKIIKAVDGTSNFSRVGGNTSSALSIAVAKAGADSMKIPLYRFLAPESSSFSLPLPLGNIIGGGAHAMGPTPDMQEHLVLPVNIANFKEAVTLNIRVHEETGKLLTKKDKNFTGGSDDERAWAADLNDYQSLEILSEACSIVTRATGAKFRLGLDLAADRLWDRNTKQYVYNREAKSRNTEEQISYIKSLVKTFNLIYVEDAFHSSDYSAFAQLRKSIGKQCLVCGDDLLATNQERTRQSVQQNSVNAMIIKINQIGTVTGARQTNNYAQSQQIKTIISHRSGETDDSAIAHIGVAWQCALIKTGVLGGERLSKLNELIRIEEDLGHNFQTTKQSLADIIQQLS